MKAWKNDLTHEELVKALDKYYVMREKLDKAYAENMCNFNYTPEQVNKWFEDRREKLVEVFLSITTEAR